MSKQVTSRRDAQGRWFATVGNGLELLIGKEVSYQGNRGLSNTQASDASRYEPADFSSFGHWANLIDPTAFCESRRSFCALNTYDRARFTFGLLQFGAHEPNGHFVVFLRRLLGLPAASDYFPELSVSNARVVLRSGDDEEILETDDTTLPLQAYLNPDPGEVDPGEVERAALLLDLTTNDPGARLAQVDVGTSLLRGAMQRYAVQYSLDGRIDTICCVVADIRHQGRAKSTQIKEALAGSNPLEALLGLGAAQYPRRIADLRASIESHVSQGTLGTLHYDASSNSFT